MTLQVVRTKTETIDKLLKRFKTKASSTKLVKKIRSRMYYEKPSIVAKRLKSKGAYKQKFLLESN